MSTPHQSWPDPPTYGPSPNQHPMNQPPPIQTPFYQQGFYPPPFHHPPAPTPHDPQGPKKGRRLAWLGAAAVVAAAAVGAGVGHLVWPAPGEHAAMSASAPKASSAPQDSPGSGAPGGQGGAGDQSGSGNQGGGPQTFPPQLLPPGLLPQILTPGGGSAGQPGDDGSRTSSAPGAPSNLSSIADTAEKSIVDINVTFQYQQAMGAGTGIVLTNDGEVLTNNHVIDGATSISVTDLGNGKTYPATVTGFDPTDDVAVLQLKGATGLATASIAPAGSLHTGDGIVGIGNAGGLGGTPSVAGGSVTALNRSITVGDDMYGTTTTLSGLIEVNADIESGDSGGPLVDDSARVVGMDTAAAAGPVATTSGHDGYAIPIGTALGIAKTIESGHGTDTVHVGPAAALGILVSSGNHGQLGSLGSAPATEPVPGALVAGVIAGGAGAQAGLVAGDVITALDGATITSAGDLSAQLIKDQPGQSVTLGWTGTDGTAHHATVTLGTGPAS